MPTYTGTANNDSWTVVNPGTFTLDGLGGVDTLYLGTSLRSSYTITKTSDGAVHVDSISGASGALHATLYNMETLVFNNKRDTLDLATYFGGNADTTPPLASLTDNVPGTAAGNLTYTLAFSENVSGLEAGDFSIVNGHIVSIAGSGASYAVVVAPDANIEGAITLRLNAGAVTDAAGNPNAAVDAAIQAVDTLAPSVVGASPGNGATGVAVGSSLAITFSETIQRGAGAVTLKDGSGATVANFDAATSANLVLAGNTLTIDPSTDLALGTTYTVVVPAGAIRDSAGNALASALSYDIATTSGAAGSLVVGTAGNDNFVAGSTMISFDGLAGVDSVSFAKPRASYAVAHTATGWTVGDGPVTDTLTNIERLHFSDGALALDVDGHAGQTAKILGAVFGASAVANQGYAGIGLHELDAGMDYAALMQLALDTRLGPQASHAAVVNLLYTNVVGSAPSAADAAPFLAMLDSGGTTTAALAVMAADTSLNLQHIDLAGLASTGLAFTG